jgi:hypothetical protein
MTTPENIQRFQSTVLSSDPLRALQQLAVSFVDEGMSQTEMYDLFERFLIQTSSEDPTDDVIADTMDLICAGP